MRKGLFILLILLVLSLSLVGCGKKDVVKDNDKTIADALRFKEEYESLNGTKNDDGKEIRNVTIAEDNVIVYKSAEELVKMIDNKESFVVYFGENDCPWCRAIVPALLEVANEEGIGVVYYVSVKDIRDTIVVNDNNEVETSIKGSQGYYDLLDRLGAVLNDYIVYSKDNDEVDTKEKRIYAPSVISVIDGKAQSLENGISEEMTNPYQEITSEMINDSKGVFKTLISDVVASTMCIDEKEC